MPSASRLKRFTCKHLARRELVGKGLGAWGSGLRVRGLGVSGLGCSGLLSKPVLLLFLPWPRKDLFFSGGDQQMRLGLRPEKKSVQCSPSTNMMRSFMSRSFRGRARALILSIWWYLARNHKYNKAPSTGPCHLSVVGCSRTKYPHVPQSAQTLPLTTLNRDHDLKVLCTSWRVTG